MFPIRRAALRLLSIKPAALAARSSTAVSFTAPSLRIQAQTSALLYQRRWASDEPAVSRVEPTPQAEVDNVVHEEAAAREDEAATASAVDSVVQEEPSVDTAGQVSSRDIGNTPDVGQGRSGATTQQHAAKPTLYIGNLFFDVTEDDLSRELSSYGTINRVKIIRDPRGLSKGFGYVTFATTEEATAAMTSLNDQLFEGRRITLQYAAQDGSRSFSGPRDRDNPKHQSRPTNPPSRTLFIGNMSFNMTDKDLNAMFKDVPGLVDVRVAVDRRTGQPRGFAHADFQDVKGAMEGMKILSTKESYGRRLRLDYSYAPSTAPRNRPRDDGDL